MFITVLDKEEVEVEVLNSTPEGSGSHTSGRESTI